ncbi:Satratoxin biosynthesis SC1 cluster protein 4 [Colletotrichum sp. SAR11_59]|nr:Satratoxin biosynthesis SC1 cluster protein 4 [Colletotrichum sp. SAR11_59]
MDSDEGKWNLKLAETVRLDFQPYPLVFRLSRLLVLGVSMAWRRPFGDRAAASGTVVEGQVEQISNGSVQYIGEKGGNDAPPTYQDASGAPVENNSPLGYSVGPVTITLLNITMMIGAGIYSTLMANYLIAISGHEGTDWQIKGTALACYTLATLTLVFNTKYAYWFSNGVGIVKICTLLFVIITGFVVLGGHTKVQDPTANFKDAWSGSSSATAYGMTTALYRIIFSYGGYNNAFNVANEVKNPVRSLKIYATAALTTVYVLYMFANVAFFAAVNDLGVFPQATFNLAMAVGIYVVRWRRSKLNLPEPEFKAWHVVIIFNICIQLYLLIMPWYPPAGGQYAGDVSFWYATLLACAAYYWFWAFLIPKWKGYKLRQELISFEDGAQSNQLRKVPYADVAEWDATHDAAGRTINNTTVTEAPVQEKAVRTSSEGSNSDVGNSVSCVCTNTTLLEGLSGCVQTSCEWRDQLKLSYMTDDLCRPYPHASRDLEIKLVVAVLAVLTFPVVILRLVSRRSIAGKLELDDWTTLVTAIVLAATMGCVIASAKLGFGLHYWNVNPANAQRIIQLYYAVQMLYIIVLILAKISIVALFARVFPSRKFQLVNRLVFVFLVGHGLIFTFVIMFECTPIAGIWDRTLIRKCVDLNAVALASAILSIVEDIVILAMPIQQLSQLQLGSKKKLAVIFMFSLGSFACITSIVRLRWLVLFADSYDTTWDNVDFVTWSITEISVALIMRSVRREADAEYEMDLRSVVNTKTWM